MRNWDGSAAAALSGRDYRDCQIAEPPGPIRCKLNSSIAGSAPNRKLRKRYVVTVAPNRVRTDLCFPFRETVTDACDARLPIHAADPHADRLQHIHDAGLVWAPALQGGAAHGRGPGGVGDSVCRILAGGAGKPLGQRGLYD